MQWPLCAIACVVLTRLIQHYVGELLDKVTWNPNMNPTSNPNWCKFPKLALNYLAPVPWSPHWAPCWAQLMSKVVWTKARNSWHSLAIYIYLLLTILPYYYIYIIVPSCESGWLWWPLVSSCSGLKKEGKKRETGEGHVKALFQRCLWQLQQFFRCRTLAKIFHWVSPLSASDSILSMSISIIFRGGRWTNTTDHTAVEFVWRRQDISEWSGPGMARLCSLLLTV